MAERDDDDRLNRWRIRREISVGDIFLAVSVAVSIGVPLVYWATGIDRRLAVVEERMVMQRSVDEGQNQVIHDSVLRIESEIRDLNVYLINGTHGR